MRIGRTKNFIAAAVLILSMALASCTGQGTSEADLEKQTASYLNFLDTEPKIADPQRISEDYTVALNVFDRLVETEEEDGKNRLKPSLADSWEVSDDGLEYTFRLHEGVTFSNGEALTAEDVRFTFERLLTHPDSKSRDLAANIRGAAALSEGRADELAGFEVLDDYSFRITLETPYAAFLEALSTPGASILDRESTLACGDDFGTSPETTVGTGPFVISQWLSGETITMTANESCWAGPPACAGLKMMFYSDTDPLMNMFQDGEIDILDLDKLSLDAEYFLHGDSYRKNLVRGERIGIFFIALNANVAPLGNVKVRKALQLALDRNALLEVGAGGRGVLENGIIPRGAKGYNEDLEEIPYDPEEAKRLLAETGFTNFYLNIGCPVSASQSTKEMLKLVVSMWEDIGLTVGFDEMDDSRFTERWRSGMLACYAGSWTADFNDPDNFFYTFFGTRENTNSRSLGYRDEEVMQRVRDARTILDEEERIAEYQDLEIKIAQEDAAWIPLYSKLHFFAVSDRVEGFQVRWNGWSGNRYDDVIIKEEE